MVQRKLNNLVPENYTRLVYKPPLPHIIIALPRDVIGYKNIFLIGGSKYRAFDKCRTFNEPTIIYKFFFERKLSIDVLIIIDLLVR